MTSKERTDALITWLLPAPLALLVFAVLLLTYRSVEYLFGYAEQWWPGFAFDRPDWLWLLLLALPIVALGWWGLNTLDMARRVTAMVLRLVVLLLLVTLLAGFQWIQRYESLSVVAVVDTSDSVRSFYQTPLDEQTGQPLSIEQLVRQQLKQAVEGKRSEDTVGLVVFDGKAKVTGVPRSEPGELQFGEDIAGREGSDPAEAIRTALALLPPNSGKRLVVFWDGHADSVAAVEQAAYEAKAAGVPIDVFPLEYKVDREVMVEALYAPEAARKEQSLRLRVVLSASAPADGKLYLKHDGVPVRLSRDSVGLPVAASEWQPRDERGGKFGLVRSISLPAAASGANRFEAYFEAADGQDRLTSNNTAETFTIVQGKGRTLIVNGVEGPAGDILGNTLEREGIDIKTVPPSGLPISIAGMNRYDAIILQDVSYDQVGPAKAKRLAEYVNNLGGGMVMVGGPNSFAAGGWTNSAVDKILPIECNLPSQTILPSGALVIVIDRSGSMEASESGTTLTNLQLAKQSARESAQTLFPQDYIGVIAFDSSAHWIVKLQKRGDGKAIDQSIGSLQAGGGTNMYEGLKAAYRALAPLTERDAAIRHIILLTDGYSEGDFQQDGLPLAQQLKQAGITLSTVGVGSSADHQTLGQLSHIAGGQHHQITNPAMLPQIFIKEAIRIRKNLVKEENFVPRTFQSSPITQGLGSLPELKGFVLTGRKADPRAKLAWLGPENEPIFAHWQSGLGRSAAFTSDATSRWAANWINWPGYADFWKATMDWVSRPIASSTYDLKATVEGDTLRVRLDAYDDARDEAFVTGLTVRGMVTGPSGESIPVTLEQTGPGIYETSMPAPQAGSYMMTLLTTGPDGNRGTILGGATKAPGAELRQYASNRGMIERIADITGGRVLKPGELDAATLFDRSNVVKAEVLRPMWWPVLVLLLILFLLDVACRRLAWSYAGIMQGVRARMRDTLSLFETREVEAGQTMEALKRRSAATESRLNQASQKESRQEIAASAAAAKARAEHKFVAAEDAKVSGNLAEVVGGASATQNASVRRGDKQDQTDDGPVTSKLLDAKRRARERLLKQHQEGKDTQGN